MYVCMHVCMHVCMYGYRHKYINIVVIKNMIYSEHARVMTCNLIMLKITELVIKSDSLMYR